MKTNPYRNSDFVGANLFLQPVVIPPLLFQATIILLFTELSLYAVATLIVGLLIFYTSDELKLIRYLKSFKKTAMKFHFFSIIFSLIIGIFYAIPLVTLLVVFDVMWAFKVYKVYQGVYPK
jgi:hypothetical protein